MSGIRSLTRRPTVVGSASGASCPIYCDSDDNIVKVIPAGSGTTEVQLLDASSAQSLTNKSLVAPAITGATTIGTGATITTPTINGAQGTIAYERLITTRLLTAADSGKTFGLALVGGFTVTLPALAAGLKFNFVIEVAPTTAYIIASAEGDNLAGVAASQDGAAVTGVQAGFVSDQVNLVATKALIGDVVEIVSVGTAGWSASAIVNANDAITFTG